MPWEKGQSGNPHGRPPKSRALTEVLRKQGSRTVVDVDGKRRAGSRVMARALWELATLGYCKLRDSDGKVQMLEAAPRDWLEVVKFIYRHIDGPPPQELDITSAGESIQLVGGVDFGKLAGKEEE